MLTFEDATIVVDLSMTVQGDMGIDNDKLIAYFVDILQNRKYVALIEMVENAKKEDDIYTNMRARRADVTDSK